MKKKFRFSNRLRTTERFIENFYSVESKDLLPEQVEAIRRFDMENNGNDYSVMTRKNYVTVLRDLAKTIRKPFEKMTKEDLGKFLDKINRTYSPTTAQQKKIQMKRFFKFVYGTDTFPEVVRWISTRKSKRHTEPKKKVLSIEERKAIMDACRNQRDRALIAFLDHSGCRAEEMTNTKIKDIEPDGSGQFITITLGKGKTGRRRIVITEGVSDIQLYLNMHEFKHDPDAPFLISFSRRDKQKAVQPRSLNGILANLGERAGIERRIYPHLFRHTRAWICKKVKGWNEDQMRVFFGWVQGSKMPSYYGHLSADDVNDLILVDAGLKAKNDIEGTDIKDRSCSRCHSKNPYDAKYCNTCSLVLGSKTIEKHAKIIKTSDTIIDIASERNLGVKEAIDKHLEEIRTKLMAEFNQQGAQELQVVNLEIQ